MITRREFLQRSAIACAISAASPVVGKLSAESQTSFQIEEATITELQQGMASGQFTAQWITETYLKRIEAIDKNGPSVNSILEVNPDAMEIAESLDRERKEKGARGPLHGVPLLIKDNIDTADKMMTTAGSLALVGAPKPPHDAFVAQQLRKACAGIVVKRN